jgi:rhodanese-related sulfurtransferase
VPIQSISPKQACDLLDAGSGWVYLDVRSIPKFFRGHPRGAVNVPLAHADPSTGQMVANPDFLRVVRANFSRETPLLIGCFSGGRSTKAAELLEHAGYRTVTNVRCGFGGARDAMGRVVEPGWSDLGLPVEEESREGESYEALRLRADS